MTSKSGCWSRGMVIRRRARRHHWRERAGRNASRRAGSLPGSLIAPRPRAILPRCASSTPKAPSARTSTTACRRSRASTSTGSSPSSVARSTSCSTRHARPARPPPCSHCATCSMQAPPAGTVAYTPTSRSGSGPARTWRRPCAASWADWPPGHGARWATTLWRRCGRACWRSTARALLWARR